mmetsp:Transcript_6824/g.19747  ORF Transcript_6824/g.19747 Transcript_6824/m.19747 type:complete len:88 (-) Transcript_6824:194-457(-)
MGSFCSFLRLLTVIQRVTKCCGKAFLPGSSFRRFVVEFLHEPNKRLCGEQSNTINPFVQKEKKVRAFTGEFDDEYTSPEGRYAGKDK